jgi:hypothetical protein
MTQQEDNDQDSAACSLEDDEAEGGSVTDNDNGSDAHSDSGADSEHSDDEFNTAGTAVNFSSSVKFQQQQLQQQQARHQSIDSYQVRATTIST